MIGAKSAPCIRNIVFCLSAVLVIAQPGFLSIDCGSTANYTDELTGIDWVTDEGYVTTGVNTAEVSKAGGSLDNLTQIWDNRFFPERKKNCYILPAERWSSYLIRATFRFLDKGQIVSDLSFQLYVNSTLWTTISYTNSPGSGAPSLDSVRVFEAIVNSTGEEIHVCLVRGQANQGDPFISALELRKFDPTMYAADDTGLNIGQILFLELRWNLGDPVGPKLRYPDDPYDRIWDPYTNVGSIFCPGTLNASRPDTLISHLSGNRVPRKVMQDACVGTANQPNISFSLNFPATVQVFYGILYFQEIDDNATATNIRTIRVQVNFNTFEPNDFNVTRSVNQEHSASFNLSTSVFSATLSIAPGSQLPPIANAAEYYFMNNVSSSSTDANDASALERLKVGFNLLDYTGDPCYPAAWDWIVCNATSQPARVTQVIISGYDTKGSLDPAIGDLSQLTSLLLDTNQLSGVIPDLRGLTKLVKVHLQNNYFSGAFPEYLLLVPSLAELDVSNNSLDGALSTCPGTKLQLLCDGNPLFDCESKLDSCAGSGGGGTQVATLAGGAVAGFVVLSLIVVGLVLILLAKRKRALAREAALRQSSDGARTKMVTRASYPSNFSGDQNSACFTLEQIQKLTNNYEKKIGQGSYGAVYLGELGTGKKIAVKVHDAMSRQGINEFTNEVNLLSRVHHRNLVSLLGYCEEMDQQVLVYEYMGNGTLREHIYGNLVANQPLSWRTRLDIAIDSGKGLEYLHKDCHPQIIHRDVKSSNILLDEKFVAKVADFGLSKAGPDGGFESGVSTVVKGTPGYFDPEYFMTQRLTHKSDVYSFGIVLLELISGVPPFNSRLPDGSSGTLVEWVQRQLPTNILSIADEKLKGQYNEEVMIRVIELAVSCIALQSVNRPDMEQIVRVLCEARESEFPVEIIPRIPLSSLTSPTPHTSISPSMHSTDSSGTPTEAVLSSACLNPPSIDASYQVGR
ncbi:hypothetical protein Mapa_015149 [Marchantia paleacea]|nr:hypothetical protein Mapa_015149 [Marchantia paleacea]